MGAMRTMPAAAALAAAATVLLYAGGARLLAGEAGFPLDDSWIHQTVARNLARHGEVILNPGAPVALTSSPLWTALLAPAYVLDVPPLAWTLGLGACSAAGLVAAMWALARAAFPAQPWAAGVAAAAGVLDWRLLWAAAGGMETTLFAALSTALLAATVAGWPAWVLGLCGGLAILARPEGALLVALTAIYRAWTRLNVGPGMRAPVALGELAQVIGLSALLAAPVAVMNVHLSGSPLPATAAAKSAAYAGQATLASSAVFIGSAALSLLSGPALFVLVGLFWWSLPRRLADAEAGAQLRSARDARLHPRSGLKLAANVLPLGWRFSVLRRGSRGINAPVAILAAWPGLLIALYAWRLPALYHYGRYILPALPCLIVLGATGGERLWRRLPMRKLAGVYLGLALAGSLTLWAHGGWRFARDVRWIQDEQVAAARWVRDRTPPGAVIATHDIGAMAYFSGRRVIDTAGLADSGALPYLRD
ncbi:MAG: hypothetical protein ACRDI2_23335, partial [Chloroflexota bacterium]